MGIFDKAVSTFKRYPPQYWVVISLELFERGAYYGIMGYYPVHLAQNLEFTGTMIGILYALLVFLLYFIPIIASALARKYGYKTILTLAFIMIIPTYFSMYFLKSPLAFFPAVIAWGIGAGAFKPMVSATIAHVTEKEERNSAYSIYYLSINWGSLLAMGAIGFLIPEAFAQVVFVIGGILITINLLITIFLYRSPVEKNPQEKISTAFVKMGKVLSDKRFTILLILYAGFFFIFSSMHTFLPIYYVQFAIKPVGWFEAPLMSAFNPLTIVILGPFLSRFMDRFQSLKLMITGMLLFSIGLLILGWIPIWQAMIMGIIIFSIGEFITHPNFISYVSKIAPEEKVALYMGYAFLPSAAGNVFGSLAGGVMWDRIAVGMEMPKLFWSIYVGIGLLSIGNFLIYNKFFGPKSKKLISVKKDIFTYRWSFLGVWAVIPLLVLAGLSLGTTTYVGVGGGGGNDHIYNLQSTTLSFSGTLTEGQSQVHELLIMEENVQWVNVTLTWTDEPDETFLLRTFQNQPDQFELSFTPCNSTEDSQRGGNPRNGEGELVFNHQYTMEPDHWNGTGSHLIEVTLVEVGDYRAGIELPISLPGRPRDTSNSYNIRIRYDYLVKIPVETEGSDEAPVH
ncbi:MAG: MFS transporter [Thermoplasmatota archaeon]